MSFSLIAAIGKNRELGKDGKLLWHLPGDMKFFKETTMGHPVLMGRKTFESLPGMLEGRKHYVVTRGQSEEVFGALRSRALAQGKTPPKTSQITLVNDLRAFIDEHKDDSEEIFVIGGGMVYWETWKDCEKLYLCEVEAEDETADTFFPEFDESKYTRKVLMESEDNGIKYKEVLWQKI